MAVRKFSLTRISLIGGLTLAAPLMAVDSNKLGLVQVLADAADQDPQLSGQISNKPTAYDKALAYFNKLFFPNRQLDFFQKHPRSFIEFRSYKGNCHGTHACGRYYAFENLAAALQKFSKRYPDKVAAFGDSGNKLNDKREIAAFLAHIGQETNGGMPPEKAGSPYSFTAITEGSCFTSPQSCADYGEHEGDVYYGRGPKQLSYPYNYKFYSQALYGDYTLYKHPDIIGENEDRNNGIRGWETALAYMLVQYNDSCEQGKKPCGPRVSPEYYNKPNMRQGLLADKWNSLELINSNQKVKAADKYGPYGFGQTINIINGGVECKAVVKAESLNRINNYIELLLRFGAPVESVEITYYDNKLPPEGSDAPKPRQGEQKKDNEPARGEQLEVAELKKNMAPLPPEYQYSWNDVGIYNTQPLPGYLYNYTRDNGARLCERFNNCDKSDAGAQLYWIKYMRLNYKTGHSERLDCSDYPGYGG